MPSILDQRVGIGKETAYGTAVPPRRHYEARSDPWQRAVERIASGGFRQGRQAQRTDRDTQIDTGASGSIETAIFDSGMGLLLEDLLGANTAPAQIGATGTYTHIFSSNTDGPEDSWTVQVVRALGSALQAFDYAGCIPTGFSMGVSNGESAMLTVNYDARSEAKNAAPTAAVYPATQAPFDWTDATLSVDGSQVEEYQSISIDGDMSFATDLYFLRRSALKDKPRRSGVPTYSGTVSGLPTGTDEYDRFVSGDVFPLVWELNNGGAGATLRSFRVSMPAVKFTGSSPTSSPDALTSQDLPFTAFHDGASPVMTITVVTTDSAF